MAIKTSNQIVFTEQKKVLDIIEWYLVSDQAEGITVNKETMEADGWTNQVASTTEEKPYLWNCEEVVYSIGDPEISDPAIIRTYGRVSDIVNYYKVTSNATVPAVPDDLQGWTDDFSEIQMSSTNKYLWNLEIIVYADGTTNFSKPTIAGVYGDSAVTLKIYSLDGLEFSDSIEADDKLENITLKVYALKGSEQITDATFTWSYYTPNDISGIEGDVVTIENNNENGRWVDIEGYTNVTNTEFPVNIGDPYAFHTLRCMMTYKETEDAENKYLYDYITLTKKTDIYTSSIKFFSGNNVFAYGQEHIIGYVEIYKNNKLVESPASGIAYHCTDIDKTTGIITTDYELPTDVEDPAYGVTQIYFTYHTDEKCNIVLGEYDESSQTWSVIEPQTQYIYVGNSDLSMTADVFVVSKKNITRSKDVNISIYTRYINLTDENDEIVTIPDPDSLLTSISTTLIDLNDTIVGGEEAMPQNPYDGQMWFNTDENALMVYKIDEITNTGTWVYSSVQQVGKAVHISQPSSYQKDDLWIVEDNMTVESYIDAEVTNETEGDYYVFESEQYVIKRLPEDYNDGTKYYSKFTYTSGATLKAVAASNEFNPNHWIAVNPTLVYVQDGVSQFFKFDPITGLRIGKIDQSFHVNLSATEMGFYVNNQRQVHIGTESTSIKNLTVEDSADFNCEITLDNQINIINTNSKNNAKYPGFVWKIESDGGFSLVKMEV